MEPMITATAEDAKMMTAAYMCLNVALQRMASHDLAMAFLKKAQDHLDALARKYPAPKPSPPDGVGQDPVLWAIMLARLK